MQIIQFCAFVGIYNLCRTVEVVKLTIGEKKEVLPE